MVEIQLGQRVRDKVSTMEGIAVARVEWLNGCVRYAVQPQVLKDGVPTECPWVDEPQLEVVDETKVVEPTSDPPAGGRPDTTRAPDPTQR